MTISRDGDVVHWDWSREVPMNRGVSFAAADYDREVARLAADLSWETPTRIAGRLVWTNLDHARLRGYGIRVSHVSAHYCETFDVTLEINEDYQICHTIPWHGRDPEELAREVCAATARPPEEWHASWHPIDQTLSTPPIVAGPSWQRAQF